MADSLALVSDLEVRLRLEVGSLEGADLLAAQTALDDASVLVWAEGNPAWTAATIPALAKSVVVRVALRQFRNPDGFSTESMGGGAYSYRYADDETSAYLTAQEADLVQKAAVEAAPGTVRPTGGSVRMRSSYSVQADPPPPLLGW